MLGRPVERGVDVLGEHVAIANECVGHLTHFRHVVSAAWIALVDRRPRIAPRFALGLRAREGNVGTGVAEESAGPADLGVAEIPPGIGGERYADLGQPDTANLVAVGVDLRHEQRLNRPETTRRGQQRVGCTTSGRDRAR